MALSTDVAVRISRESENLPNLKAETWLEMVKKNILFKFNFVDRREVFPDNLALRFQNAHTEVTVAWKPPL